MKTKTPLAVIVFSKPSGKLVEYRGFVQAATEPGYLEQLASNPNNEIKVVEDIFQYPPRTRNLGPTRSQRLYAKPRKPVAELQA